jgi:hypothetical protein
MAIVRVVRYIIKCDGCGKEVSSEKDAPTTGVMGEIEFPNSGFGQRKNFTFYSCKEDATHIAKAMRVMVAKREEDVASRKSRGEAYNGERG